MAADISRVPPHSAEAERAILGAALRNSEALSKILERISEEDLYLPAHREIFAAMEALHVRGLPVDEVTLIEHLEKHNILRDVGGFTYVTDLQQALPILSNLPHYVAIVEEKSILRKMIVACEEIIGDCYAGQLELNEVLANAEKKVFDISLRNTSRGLEHIEKALTASYFQISERTKKTGLTGLPSGFVDLDQKISGLQRSDLVVIAGRPAMGKTSFAINMAQHSAVHENAVVAIFSLEMSREQLTTRMLCTEARVDMQRVKSGLVTPEDWKALAGSLKPLAQAKMYVDDTAGITLAEMRSKLRRLKIELGTLDLVVIDYLQLMTYRGKADNRQQEISDTTRQLKIMARDLDVPILLLSQLSRAPDQRADHRPMMSDLRESGAIEQDADIIIMLYRESVYDEDAGPIAQAIVAKHRNGPTGEINLIWRGEYTKFENATDIDVPY